MAVLRIRTAKKGMQDIQPFANESEVIGIDGLTIENRIDRVTLYGNVDLTRDQEGLARGRALKAVIDCVVQSLEDQEGLPERIAPPAEPMEVKNPFA